MKKLTLLLAAGAGYVLGTRAGRERYEQIKRAATRVKDDPRVQEKTHQAAEVTREKVQAAAPVVKDKVATVASAAADRVTPSGRSQHAASDLEDQLPADSLVHQDSPYPKGDLP